MKESACLSLYRAAERAAAEHYEAQAREIDPDADSSS